MSHEKTNQDTNDEAFVGKLAVIGPGKVGQAMAILLQRAGFTLAAIGGRNAESTARAAQQLSPAVSACTIPEAAQAADVVLITVKDDAIEQVVDLCRFRQGATVIHMSGTHSSDVLQSARDRFGCTCASMHALQTFARVEQALATIPGCYCFIEGDDTATTIAQHIAQTLQMHPVPLTAGKKAMYHAAAVMACNFLTALMDCVEQTAEQAGLAPHITRTAFAPLIDTTLRNIRAYTPLSALTGPIVRGDVETVRTHLQAMTDHPELADVYRALAHYTACMARKHPEGISDSTYAVLDKLLHATDHNA